MEYSTYSTNLASCSDRTGYDEYVLSATLARLYLPCIDSSSFLLSYPTYKSSHESRVFHNHVRSSHFTLPMTAHPAEKRPRQARRTIELSSLPLLQLTFYPRVARPSHPSWSAHIAPSFGELCAPSHLAPLHASHSKDFLQPRPDSAPMTSSKLRSRASSMKAPSSV